MELGKGKKKESTTPIPVVDDRVKSIKKEFAGATGVDDFPIYDEINPLMIDPELQAYLTHLGFVWRFINWPKYQYNANMHPTQWKPFIVPPDAPKGVTNWKFGMDANGMIRRGDIVLAVKPVELHQKHREVLNSRNQSYKSFQDKKAKEFKDFAKDRGIKTQVTQGS